MSFNGRSIPLAPGQDHAHEHGGTWESFAVKEQEHIDRQKGMAAPGIVV
jgi:hypothetical protein